jgi:hypothetical protein
MDKQRAELTFPNVKKEFTLPKFNNSLNNSFQKQHTRYAAFCIVQAIDSV